MGVVAMTLSASAAVATDQTQNAQALIGDFTPDRPDVGTVGFPSPQPGAGPFTPPVVVSPDLPGSDEPPAVLTVEVVLQNLVQLMNNELNHQYLVSLEILEGIARDVAASSTPASRETIAAARAHFKAIAKAKQAEMQAIVIEATAQVRAMGASKDQMKALSNNAKAFRYTSKLIAKSLHDETGDLGSGS